MEKAHPRGREYSQASLDFCQFKELFWIPLLNSRMNSRALYISVYNKYIEPFLRGIEPGEFSAADAARFAAGLSKAGLAPGTYNRILSVLRHFLKSARESGIIGRDFGAEISRLYIKDKGRRGAHLEPDQIKDILAALAMDHSYQARALELLLLTGASKSGLLRARWEDYNAKTGRLELVSHKGKKRALRLGPSSLRILNSLREKIGSQWIFPGRDPERPVSDVFMAWNKARKACGLDSLRIQDLRHNFKSALDEGWSASIEEDLAPKIRACGGRPRIALIGAVSGRMPPNENMSGAGLGALLELLSALYNKDAAALSKISKPLLREKEKFLSRLSARLVKDSGISAESLARVPIILGLKSCMENFMDTPLMEGAKAAPSFAILGRKAEIISAGSSFRNALIEAAFKISSGCLDLAIAGGFAGRAQALPPSLQKFCGSGDNFFMAALCKASLADEPGRKTLAALSAEEICAIPDKIGAGAA